MANRDQKCESLVDAIGNLNGAFGNPESEAYRLKSPLMLRSFARVGKHEVNERGLRIFPSMLSGYKAATFDMALKLSGNSRAGLKPTDTLENLLRVYGLTEILAHKKCVNFLRGEWAAVRRDGTVVNTIFESVCIPGADGHAQRVVYLIDVTERRRGCLAVSPVAQHPSRPKGVSAADGKPRQPQRT